MKSNSLETKQIKPAASKYAASKPAASPVPPDGGAARRARAEPAALDPGLLPGLLGYRLRLAQQSVFRDFERSVGTLGITPGRAGMLLLIESNAGLSQSRLAEAVGLDRSTLVPILDDLERRELVERQPGVDRRTNGLALTTDGRRFLTSLKRQVRVHEDRIAARLSVAEREQLIGLLARLADEGAAL